MTGHTLAAVPRNHTSACRHIVLPSPIGDLTVVADAAGLVGLYMPDHLRAPAPHALGARVDTGFDDVADQLDEYFAGRRRTFDLDLAPRGEPFQRSVWDALLAIPFGERRTYGALAAALDRPGAAQAVGAANARNPISIIIPCHRVVGAGGALVGYAGGLERKRFLLDLEARVSGTFDRLV